MEFFIVSLMQMFQANGFHRDGSRRSIHCAIPLPKNENFFYLLESFWKKMLLAKTLKWEILYLFRCSGSPQTIHEPLHRQSFLLASMPAQTIFFTYFNPCTVCSTTFIFQLLHSPCLKSSINHLSYWSSPQHRRSFLPASISR